MQKQPLDKDSLFLRSLDLTKKLIEQQSVSPDQSNALKIIADELKKLGFKNQWFKFEQVNNLYAVFGNNEPKLVFIGHTDVVPSGKIELWKYPPFQATIKQNRLYGRGAADMKSAIAAFLAASEKYLEKNTHFQGSIAFLITADEEAEARNGTRKVVEELIKRGEKINYCLVGEPSSIEKTGDMIKNGRRGSLSGKLIILGKQGHIAYPDKADNPIDKIPLVLNNLLNVSWDKGNEFFEPTSLQFSNIHAGTGANNVIPNECVLDFNFRYSNETTAVKLKKQFEQILKQKQINYQISWQESGNPFLSKPDKLTQSTIKAINKIQGFAPIISTSGGTSDGRFMAKMQPEIIECGLSNATIHQINESIGLTQLQDLSHIYYQLLNILFKSK